MNFFSSSAVRYWKPFFDFLVILKSSEGDLPIPLCFQPMRSLAVHKRIGEGFAATLRYHRDRVFILSPMPPLQPAIAPLDFLRVHQIAVVTHGQDAKEYPSEHDALH
jgi:hypothetical protein